MTAGWCSRTVRAAVFAAVCVLLATLGHVLMSGASVPWWVPAAGAVATGASAWCLAGRERGLRTVVPVAVLAQAALHSSYSLAQAAAHPAPPDGASLADRWLRYLLCGSAPATGGSHLPGAAHDMGSMTSMESMTSMGPMEHGMAGMGEAASAGGSPLGMSVGMSPLGMLAAHLLAALVCGLWLAYGERAAFRILRAVAARLVAPLRVPLRVPAPPHRPRLPRRGHEVRVPRQSILVHALTSRGPPMGTAVI